MNIFKKTIYCVITYLILTSCSSSTKKDIPEFSSEFVTLNNKKDFFVIDIDSVRKEKVFYISNYFKNVRAIALENNKNALIGRINKLIVFDEYLFILDSSISKGLFVFNKEGVFIRKIGNVGGGPGEYINISDFTIDADKKEIYLLDSRTQKINIYDIDFGKFINSVRIKNDYVRSYRVQSVSGKLYTDAYFPVESENNFLLRSIDLSTGEQDSCWMSSAEYNKGWNELFFNRHNFFIPTNTSSAKFNQIFMDMVVSITSEGVSPYLIIKSKDLLTEKDLQATKGNPASDRFASLMNIDKIHGINDYLEFGKYIYYKFQRKNSMYPVLFDTKTRKAQVSEAFIDDLIYTKDMANTILPTFYYADSNKVYGILQNHNIERFLQLAKDGYLSNLMNSEDVLMKLTENSNPVIFCYECKD